METTARLVSFALLLVMARAYFESIECPPTGKEQIVCSEDCRKNHGALYGHCGNSKLGDYNCYCSEVLQTVNNNSIQCRDAFNPLYDLLCRLDCYCLHAATESKCHWDTFACECIGQHPDPYGRQAKGLCPHQNYSAFVKSITELSKSLPNLPQLSPKPPKGSRPKPKPKPYNMNLTLQ